MVKIRWRTSWSHRPTHYEILRIFGLYAENYTATIAFKLSFENGYGSIDDLGIAIEINEFKEKGLSATAAA